MHSTESRFASQFRRHVRALMLEQDVSVEEMAEALNLGRNAMYARLQGNVRFTLDDFEPLAAGLGCDVIDLVPSITVSA